jgi:ornithine carbamoyltransferase
VEAVNMMESTSIDIFTNELIYNENNTNIPSSSNIKYYFDLNDRVIENADCIMTDVYNSMNDKEDKESLLLKFQVNNNILSKMNNKAVFMHCLPAKINSEVTEDVLKSSKSIVLKQAKNRMVAQRGILKWLEI